MEFLLLTVGMVAFIVVILVLLARAYPGSGADLVDWRPSRSFEDEAKLEMEDIQQMMDAQNEYRRKRGEAEVTDSDVQKWVEEDEQVRARARRAAEESAAERSAAEAEPGDDDPVG